jgi:archaetidylinositol phosphate synthase
MADHVRYHRSLLAAAEKRLLVAIAARVPRFVNSDHLTLLALAAMGVAGLAFGLARFDARALWIVVLALAVNWFGDSLDGTLARVRRVERPRYGFYVDHVVDIAGAAMLFAGMAASGFMNPLIALGVLVAYLLVTAEVFLASGAVGVFRVSFGGVGPTELRILLAAGAVALRSDPHVDLGNLGRLPLFDAGGLIAIAGLAIAFVAGAIRNTRILARQEPRPTPAGRADQQPCRHSSSTLRRTASA